jgi:type II secretory ATPase GspE/PulE/Tfp pilus assembly ATPase PilB-like protein
MLRVINRTSQPSGRETVVTDEVVRLGRSPACQIMFDAEAHPTVSRQHAEFRWEKGYLFLHPTPGHAVLRQGQVVAAPTRLRPGDVIELVEPGGPSIELAFEEPRAPGALPIEDLAETQKEISLDPLRVRSPEAKTESVEVLRLQSIPDAAPAAVQRNGAAGLIAAPEGSVLDHAGETTTAPEIPTAYLEGAEIDRVVPVTRRKAAPSRLPVIVIDVAIIVALCATVWALLTRQPFARVQTIAVAAVALGRLLVGRMMSSRKVGDGLHISAIDLTGISPDGADRVQRVARLLTQRGEDEAVEVVDLVDDILVAADFLRASDVHVEPKENDIRLAFRIDGVMHEAGVFPKEIAQRLANRFRIISKLDFAKVDTPQDGRVEEKIRGKAMNLRVSVFPTAYGAKIVVRLLDSGAHALPTLEKLGIHPLILKKFRPIIHAPQGIILFTGPTGSGKSTLMYSALSEIIQGKIKRNIVTLEDPIERLLPAINQTQVDAKRGLTFAAGLRTILRQDPDVIMVGEIRDQETAEIALRAGQTGHLLLSTLHTNSTAAAFTRLMDMGIEPFLLASAVSGVVGSRLMRKLCPNCRVKHRPPAALLEQVRGKIRLDGVFYESKGCEECRNTGFVGRILAFELLIVDKAVHAAVMAKQSSDEIQKAAVAKGMVTILEDGLARVKAGDTSLEELLRIVQ